jgi:5-methylcytosine-specific restriction endonuclease McrA
VKCKTPTCGSTEVRTRGLCQPCYYRQWRQENAAHVKTDKRRQYEENRDLVRQRSRAWQKAHPEAARAHSVASRLRYAKPRILKTPEQKQAVRRNAQQRRRARIAGAPINDFTTAQWFELLDEFDGQCAYCERADLLLQQEHKIPLSRGGSHTKSNIVPACGPCNRKKRDKTAEEFVQRQFGNQIRQLADRGWKQYRLVSNA